MRALTPTLALLARTPLLPHERAWLLQIFAAVLPTDTAGLPAPGAHDWSSFIHTLERATAPTFVPGLRVMLHALAVLPLAHAGYRRPFFALSVEARRAFLVELAHDDRYLARQLVATMKILAAFALFEDPSARAAFDTTPTVRP